MTPSRYGSAQTEVTASNRVLVVDGFFISTILSIFAIFNVVYCRFSVVFLVLRTSRVGVPNWHFGINRSSLRIRDAVDGKCKILRSDLTCHIIMQTPQWYFCFSFSSTYLLMQYLISHLGQSI